jgi:hypothetical protein
VDDVIGKDEEKSVVGEWTLTYLFFLERFITLTPWLPAEGFILSLEGGEVEDPGGTIASLS